MSIQRLVGSISPLISSSFFQTYRFSVPIAPISRIISIPVTITRNMQWTFNTVRLTNKLVLPAVGTISYPKDKGSVPFLKRWSIILFLAFTESSSTLTTDVLVSILRRVGVSRSTLLGLSLYCTYCQLLFCNLTVYSLPVVYICCLTTACVW